jgi:predicted Holliday junction resolvase-like endonuclease
MDPIQEPLVVGADTNQDLTPEPTPDPAPPPTEVVLAKLKEEKEYWKGVADGRSTAAPAPPPIPQVAPAPVDPEPEVAAEPRFEDFSDPGKFYAAQTRHLRSQQQHDAWRDRQTRREQERVESAQRTEREKQQRAMETFESRLAEAAKVEPDIYTIRESLGTRVAQHTARLLIESEYAPRLLRHLSDNPAVLARINSMDPLAAVKEVAKIELGLSKGLTDDSGRVKVVSDTPAPAPSVPGKGPNVDVSDPGDPDAAGRMDPNDWVYKRNMQVLGRLQQADAARASQRR